MIAARAFWISALAFSRSASFTGCVAGALEAGDAERAEIVMREHVYEGRDFVIRALKEDMDA